MLHRLHPALFCYRLRLCVLHTWKRKPREVLFRCAWGDSGMLDQLVLYDQVPAERMTCSTTVPFLLR